MPHAPTSIKLRTCAAISAALITVLFALPLAQADEPRVSADRPRIGLVLGGGGAKGIAHVGVLQVLDELHVPIDCVAGTSMGALVGGIYAAGMPAGQLGQEVTTIDWAETVGGKGNRELIPVERKLEQRSYNNSSEVGIQNGKFVSAKGFVDTQDIEGLIRDLVSDARFRRDFNDLPIPFRAVATDMVSGDVVVMGSGDLSVAMRASMAMPGVFSPVMDGDRVLSDGGQLMNLPVDVARDLCADVVIAVWLSTPPITAKDLSSAAGLLSRSTDVMIEANEKAQIATLTELDVGISVPMGDIGTGDFSRATDAAKLGRAAAEAVADELRRFAVPEEEYLAWRATIDDPKTGEVQLADVRIVGLDRVNPEYVRGQLRVAVPGAVVTTEDIAADTNRIYALGDFERVGYRFTGPADARVLEIEPVEKSYGPNFFRARLGLYGQTDGELMGVIGVQHKLTWVNSLGGEWRNALQVGRTALATTQFYQPLDTQHRFFVQPILMTESTTQDIYDDGAREAIYIMRETYGEIDLGTNIGTHAQLRTGLQSGWIDAKRDTGLSLLPDLDKENDSNVFVSGIVDTRDNVGLPTSGTYMNVNFRDSGSWLSGEQEYTMAEGVITSAFPLRGNALTLLAAGGKELAGDLPVTRDFMLGGINSFPGLYINELRGTSYWVAGASYRQKVAEILSLFNQSLYAGARLQAGRMGGSRDGISQGTLYGISGGISGRTPIGAFNVSLGYVNNDSWALQFAIGAPVPEGSVLDQIN
jgi:NTE family protein